MPLFILYCKPRGESLPQKEFKQLRVFLADAVRGTFHQIAWSSNFTIVAVDKDVAPKLHPGVLCNFISAEDILNIEYLEENRQVRVNLSGEKSLLCSYGLENFENWLQTGGFLRVHKNHLVNQDHIFSFESNENALILTEDVQIPCDKKFVPQIIHYISNHKDHVHVNGT
ncbi:MAG: LytTR family transcriptional regulator [Bacteroidetes bacterium]|nr:MAG: LytTR family transcriptional regulator [Bacteroidota bacterium]